MIEVQHVSFSYEKGRSVIEDLSFHIAPGEAVGLIGANGAGKSTVMKLLLGLLSGEGKILVDGTELSRQTLPEIRRKLGFVLQNSDNQMFMPTVYEDMIFAPLNYGLSREEADARVDAVLQRLGLNYTYEELDKMVSLQNPNNTRILYITATSVYPDEAKLLADTYASVAREFIAATMDTQQPSIFMEALRPTKPSSPRLFRNIVIGFAIGFILSCGVVALHFIVDDKVRSADDVEKYLSMPLLGMLPHQKETRRTRSGRGAKQK